MKQKLFFSFLAGLIVSAFAVALMLGLQEASARPNRSGIIHLVLFSVTDGVTEAEAQQLLASQRPTWARSTASRTCAPET